MKGIRPIGPIRLIAGALILAWSLPAWAGVIELKDGSKIEGRIKTKSATEILVDVEGIEIKVNGDEVKAIDGMPYTCDFKALYDQRTQETPAMDIEGRFALAMWCKERGLKEQMKVEIDRILALNPNHEGSNKELGRLFVEGQWRTPDELKKLGFVKKNGEWMTPDQASQMEGKVQYMGSWVRPDEAKRLAAVRFDRYVDNKCIGITSPTNPAFKQTTHAIQDLNKEIMRLELLNMWKPTPDQLKKMWTVLNDAEKTRQTLIARLNKAWPEIEASWIALRNEALKGVVDSFDQNPAIEGRAGGNEGIWIGIKRGGGMRLYASYNDKFMEILTSAQKDMLYNKYCAMCHSTSFMKGGYGREIRGTQAGVDFLEKVRALSEEQFHTQKCDLAEEALKKFGKGPQTLLGKKAQRVGKRSSQDMSTEEMTACDIMTRARLATEKEWARTRFNFAAEIEAKNEEERLRSIVTNAAKEKGSFLTDNKAQSMVAEALFDGTLRDVVAMRLSIPKSQLVVKVDENAAAIPEFKDGETAFRAMCTMCHSMDRINKAVKSPTGWRATVTKRLHQGVSDDPKLIDMITEYLANRGTEKAEAK